MEDELELSQNPVKPYESMCGNKPLNHEQWLDQCLKPSWFVM